MFCRRSDTQSVLNVPYALPEEWSWDVPRRRCCHPWAGQPGWEGPLTQGPVTAGTPHWGHAEAEPVVGYSGTRHSLLEISFESAKPSPSKNIPNVQSAAHFILFIYTELTAETFNKYCEPCQQGRDKRISSRVQTFFCSKEHCTDWRGQNNHEKVCLLSPSIFSSHVMEWLSFFSVRIFCSGPFKWTLLGMFLNTVVGVVSNISGSQVKASGTTLHGCFTCLTRRCPLMPTGESSALGTPTSPVWPWRGVCVSLGPGAPQNWVQIQLHLLCWGIPRAASHPSKPWSLYIQRGDRYPTWQGYWADQVKQGQGPDV